MPDDAKTDEMPAYCPPAFDRLEAVLLAAAPGGPGRLRLTVLADGRLVEVGLILSAVDRLALIDAATAVPAGRARPWPAPGDPAATPPPGAFTLSVCAWCGRWRDAGGQWHDPADTPPPGRLATHGICPACEAE